MTNLDSKTAYINHVAKLEARLCTDDALRQAVGGEFIAVGKLEYYLLRSQGMTDGHLIVDVGCGSGRLAFQLAPFEGLKYIGCDVVPRLIEYAQNLSGRADWHFEATAGTRIPCDDASADFVVFFSVFTHLLHEETFRYMREAYRCLRAGGKLIFSFVEFKIPCHWNIFIDSVDNGKPGQHLVQFMDRDAINAWSERVGFSIVAIADGDRGHIPIPEEIKWENGNRMGSFGNLGQSVAILQKPG